MILSRQGDVEHEDVDTRLRAADRILDVIIVSPSGQHDRVLGHIAPRPQPPSDLARQVMTQVGMPVGASGQRHALQRGD
jgi:hypothetical protein